MLAYEGIRLNSLKLGPNSAISFLISQQQGGRSRVAFKEPVGDAEFIAAVNSFITYANANLAAVGLVAADLTPLTTALTDLETKYATHLTSQNTSLADAQAKDEARVTTRLALRTIVAKAEGSGALDNAERQSMNLTVPDTIRTPVPAPTSRPVGKVDTSQRLQHSISFQDELTPTSRAKPAGVIGCEIWVKIGGVAPGDASELSFLAVDTRSPYISTYDSEQAGQVAHYMLRWVSTRSERGPWSETVSATIGA